MVRYIRSNELYHYGRSIRDGAPGVGTGNWRRGGAKIAFKTTPLSKMQLKNDVDLYLQAARNRKSPRYWNTGIETDPDAHRAMDKLLKNKTFQNALKNLEKEYIEENKARFEEKRADHVTEQMRMDSNYEIDLDNEEYSDAVWESVQALMKRNKARDKLVSARQELSNAIQTELYGKKLNKDDAKNLLDTIPESLEYMDSGLATDIGLYSHKNKLFWADFGYEYDEK